VFIYVGRHVWFKGFHLTIQAFLKLHQVSPNAKLLVLGEPYKVHPTGLSDDQIEEMNRCPAIIKVGWVQEVQNYLSVSDVNIFPSEREGMPVNLMESICMGVPVITRDTRGCNEIVEHQKTGFLMKTTSVDELIDYMKLLMNNPAELDKQRAKCREVRHLFDRMIWVEEQIEFYENLLRSKSMRA
jgi:glycosyltransferase involved in cell wall biosynthesis